jgi:hypothetical protein
MNNTCPDCERGIKCFSRKGTIQEQLDMIFTILMCKLNCNVLYKKRRELDEHPGRNRKSPKHRAGIKRRYAKEYVYKTKVPGGEI